MMIAVEGMDGVGKTEIAKYISKEYGFKFVEKSLHYLYHDGEENGYADFMTIARKMYDINDNAIKSWYFSLGNIYVAKLFKNEDVVIDRHLVSNYYWNGDLECEPIFDALIEVSGVPDLTILMYATPKTRLERIYKRNKEDPDLSEQEKMDDGYKKMIYFINKYRLPYIVIDTEDRTLDEVKQIVDKEICKLKGKQNIIKRYNKY